MKKFYYLKTCSTCQRIMKSLALSDDIEMREIKSTSLTADEIDSLANKAGSYEAIFSKRAQKYKALGLKDQNLTERDLREYLLTDYTFLKRPVLETDNKVVAGNSQKQVDQMADLTK